MNHWHLMCMLDIAGETFAKEHHVTVTPSKHETDIKFLLDMYYRLDFDSPEHESMFKLKYAEYL